MLFDGSRQLVRPNTVKSIRGYFADCRQTASRLFRLRAFGVIVSLPPIHSDMCNKHSDPRDSDKTFR